MLATTGVASASLIACDVFTASPIIDKFSIKVVYIANCYVYCYVNLGYVQLI